MRLEHGLHARLVAKVAGHLGTHPRDAQGVTDLAERDLQLLEHAKQAIDAAEVSCHHPGGVGDLLRVGAVVHPVVSRECGAQVVAKLLLRILADEAEPDIRQRRGSGDEPHGGGEQERSDEDRVRHWTFWRV